ncbi:MAG TPA: hypothetical protein VEC16_04030 [Alphaproteobacteria bacterium]|nr:hypothetical protein [Alphaproteobacteria bacterium]
MERKLVRQGREALTVTLPSKWLKDKGLKVGNSVYIDIEKNDLVVRSREHAAEFKETTINVVDNERSMIWHKVLSKYISGYDKITVIHNNPHVTQEFASRIVGMIVEEQTNTKTVLKTLITIPENNIELIIRRIVHMFEYQASMLLNVTIGKSTSKDVNDYGILLDANINYCLRYINKYNLKTDSYKQFLICSTIEQAGDIVIILSKYLGKNSSHKKIASIIYDNVKLYNKYFFANDFAKLYSSLRNFRNNLPQKTFVDGLSFQLAELLYNNLGYLTDKNN